MGSTTVSKGEAAASTWRTLSTADATGRSLLPIAADRSGHRAVKAVGQDRKSRRATRRVLYLTDQRLTSNKRKRSHQESALRWRRRNRSAGIAAEPGGQWIKWKPASRAPQERRPHRDPFPDGTAVQVAHFHIWQDNAPAGADQPSQEQDSTRGVPALDQAAWKRSSARRNVLLRRRYHHGGARGMDSIKLSTADLYPVVG